MLAHMQDKKVVIKRYSSTLGEYNRPNQTLQEIGTHLCHVAEKGSNTYQKQPQKENSTNLTLYTDPDVEVLRGDILYIYEIDEYDKIISSTEFKALADKPYKKRTVLAVPLLSEEEV